MRASLRALLLAGAVSVLAAAPVALAQAGSEKPACSAAMAAGACAPPALSRADGADTIFAAIFGTAPPPTPTLNYPVEMFGMNRGDVRITPHPDPDRTMIDRKGLSALLMAVVTDEERARLSQALGEEQEISAGVLTGLGYQTVFDERDFILRVDVPLSYRNVIPIPLQQRYVPADTEALIRPATTSGIINLFAASSWVHASRSQETGRSAAGVNLDAAFNHRGLVLETGLRYSEDARPEYTRSDTRLTYDFVSRLIRAEAGDLTVPTTGLQGNPAIAGLSAYRQFGLDPDVDFRASPSQSFELQRPGRVAVYINGQFVRDLRLPSGRYNLTDLPLRSGAGNDVLLEIIYDTGEIERIVFSAFYDFELLRKGVSEFAFSAGPVSRIEENERRYATDNIAASFYYRLGVSDRLTFGVNAQGDRDLINAGAEAVYATPLGMIGASGAYSDHSAGSGAAATLFHRWNARDMEKPLRTLLQARFQDKGFRPLGVSAAPAYKYDLAGRISASINPRTRVQAGAGFRRYYGGRGKEYSASVSTSYDIGPGSLSASVNYFDGEGRPDWFFGLSYSMSLGKTQFIGAHDSRDRASRATLAWQPDLAPGSFGYDVSFTDQPGMYDIQAGLGYLGNRFDARLEQNYRRGEGSLDHTTSAFLGSALVYADGQMALSRPVIDSFAMFGKADGAGDFALAVDPVRGLFGQDRGYAASSSILGPAVLTDLQSYFRRSVSVEAPAAPAGTSLGENVFTFKPGYRSGHLVEVGSDRNVSLMGRLINDEGLPVRFAVGSAVSEDGEKAPVFTNAGGRFYIENLKGGGTVRLEFTNPAGAWALIPVPDKHIGLIRLETDIVLNSPERRAARRMAGLNEERSPE